MSDKDTYDKFMKKIIEFDKVMKKLIELDPDDNQGWREKMGEIQKLLGKKVDKANELDEMKKHFSELRKIAEHLDYVCEPLDEKVIDKLVDDKKEVDRKHIEKGSIGCFHRINPDTEIEDLKRKFREKNNKERKSD